MDQSEVTIAKFEACINSFAWVMRTHLSEIIEYTNNMISVDAFNKMLIKNDMEEYSTQLLSYLSWFSFEQIHQKNRIGEINIDDQEHKKDLTKTLIFLLSNEAGENSSITFQKQRDSHLITNKLIITNIIKGLIEEYKKSNYDDDFLTDEELEEELHKEINQEWIEEWIEKQKDYFDRNKEFDDNTKEFEIDYVDMYAYYWESHPIKREVNLEFLERIFEVYFAG